MWNFLGPAQRIAQANPWLKWAVVLLVGLFAVEFIAQRGIVLYVQLQTALRRWQRQTATQCKPKHRAGRCTIVRY